MIIITIDTESPIDIKVKSEVKLNKSLSIDQNVAEELLHKLLLSVVSDFTNMISELTLDTYALSQLSPELNEYINKCSDDVINNFILSEYTPDNPDEDMG